MSSSNNDIRISSSMTAIAVLDETLNGVAYTAQVVDQNIETVGGNITWTNGDGYEDAHACKWNDVGIDATAFGTLANSAWNVGDVAPTGGIPAKIRSIGVKYNSKVGSPANKVIVAVKTGSTAVPLCALSEGEGCAIPLNGADGNGFLNSLVSVYQVGADGSNYAKVTVALLGKS